MSRLHAKQIAQSGAIDDIDARQVLRWDDDLAQWVPALKMHVGSDTPTADDDSTENYDIGSLWINNDTPGSEIVYICVANNPGYAVWKRQSDATPTIENKDMVASATASDEDIACATALVATPSGGGYIQVAVNGKLVTVGDSDILGDCFFGSPDVEPIIRNIGSAEIGDLLYWVGSVAEYQLEVTDYIDFFYSV